MPTPEAQDPTIAMSNKRMHSEMAETDEHTYKSSDEDGEEDEGTGGVPSIPPVNPALLNKAEGARRDDRLKKNRQKARDRRTRKKALVEDMQRNVVVLSRMNSELRRKNQDLIRNLAQYGAAGHPGGLGGAELQGGNPLAGATAAAMAGGQQGAAAGMGGLAGAQSALGMSNAAVGQQQAATQHQLVQQQLDKAGEEANKAVGGPVSAAPGMDVSSLLSQFPGAAQAGAVANPAAAPSAMAGLQLNQIANNPALMRLLAQQQQQQQGFADTTQQLAALQNAVAAGAQFGAPGVGVGAAPAPGTLQAANALGFAGGITQQAAAAAAGAPAADSRPIQIVVHHHHPDGSQSQEQQQISGASAAAAAAAAPGNSAAPAPSANALSVAGQAGIPPELARQLNLQGLLHPGASITMGNPNP